MERVVKAFVDSLEFGELKQWKNIAVLPLFSDLEPGLIYMTLEEALAKGSLEIKEVSYSGSVSEITVINRRNTPVLLLDGEQLVGAKQNRVLNMSILVGANRESRIPVSCCERGRWQYTTRDFRPSDAVMPSSLRLKKLRYVGESLRLHQNYAARQGEVWEDIRNLLKRAGVDSPTENLEEVFKARSAEMEEALQVFTREPEQTGSLFFLNGEVRGLEVIPLSPAYKAVHDKLVRSYIADSVSSRSSRKPTIKKAQDFLREVQEAAAVQYKSPGLGYDLRYEGARVMGSALVYRDSLIQASFLRKNARGRSGPWSAAGEGT